MPMNDSGLWVVGALAVGVLVLLTTKSGGSDLNCLRGVYDNSDVDRLQNVYDALKRQDLSNEQIKYCLAQILQETGLFTDHNANYHAMDDLNNFTGISSGGKLKSYPNIDAFVTDYMRVLNLPSHYPIEAGSIDDFNNRLKANHYYEASIVTYGNNLRYYYNILSNCDI